MANMGLGFLGDRNLVFKQQNHFTFRIEQICGNLIVPDSTVKTAARPSLTVDPVEINFLNAKDWIPGKAEWNEITVTYLDVAAGSGVAPPERGGQMINLFSWLASVYDFTDPVRLYMGPKRTAYTGVGVLTMYDAGGTPLEQWEMGNMWPTSINWGNLDYATGEIAEIELTLRYSNVRYTPLCPGGRITPCYQSCS